MSKNIARTISRRILTNLPNTSKTFPDDLYSAFQDENQVSWHFVYIQKDDFAAFARDSDRCEVTVPGPLIPADPTYERVCKAFGLTDTDTPQGFILSCLEAADRRREAGKKAVRN